MYYCEVLSKDAQGYVKQIKSNHAQLRTTHNYGDGKLAIEDPNSIKRISIVVNFGNTTKGPYMQGSEYHNITCHGSMCGHLKLPADTRHTFAYIQAFYSYLTSGVAPIGFSLSRYDLNGDGKRDVYDLQLLYKVVSGICGVPTT